MPVETTGFDDLDDLSNFGWLDWARPKTGVGRRCKIWPEVQEALQAAIESRPVAKTPEGENRLFVTKYGKPWDTGKNVPVSAEFRKILFATGLLKEGRGFYALRHVAETIGSGAKDPPALNLVMGHVDDSMPAVYRERVDDCRLESIADHIRA
ncbi:MAG: site-specific integrase, partial [Polyangiaceae bacterium]|nr:site-specific integrase [Polyangiaceae bacterium]